MRHIGDLERWTNRVIQGVAIPFASARLLWRTKQTLRDKDKVDLAFLARLLESRGENVD